MFVKFHKPTDIAVSISSGAKDLRYKHCTLHIYTIFKKEYKMSSIKLLVISALMSISQAVLAQETTVETVVSAVKFDGKVLTYSYIAYDTQKVLKDSAQVVCNYANYDDSGKKVLKSIDVKLAMTANFNTPGAIVTKTNATLNIENEIQKCVSKLGEEAANVLSPVMVNLPKVSMPAYYDISKYLEGA